MASETKDLFGCPFCGFRVSSTDITCPRCGNKFSDGTLFECPFCGDMIHPGESECTSCHVNFSEFMAKSKPKINEDNIDSLLMDIISLESYQIQTEEKKKLSCPNCSWMLDGTEEKCPKCGSDFQVDSTYQCPICGSFVNANASKCSECGSDFEALGVEAEEEKAAKHEQMSSALTDLLDSAGQSNQVPEVVQPEPVPPPPPLIIAKPPKTIAKPSPVKSKPPPPEPVEAPPPEPVEEPPQVEEPPPVKQEPVPEEPEPVKETPAPAPAPKKPRTRKLKAKTA
jgi:DNA-directed RNA polymerase subunit RPC12/RpoP